MTNDILTPDEVGEMDRLAKFHGTSNHMTLLLRCYRAQSARIKRLEQENDEQRWQLRTVQVRNTVGGNE